MQVHHFLIYLQCLGNMVVSDYANSSVPVSLHIWNNTYKFRTMVRKKRGNEIPETRKNGEIGEIDVVKTGKSRTNQGKRGNRCGARFSGSKKMRKLPQN